MDIKHYTSKNMFHRCDVVYYDKWIPMLLSNQLLSFYSLKMKAVCFTQNFGTYLRACVNHN